MSKLVDEVAKAIRNDPNQPCVFDAECKLGDLCFCKSYARAALAAIEASGTHRVLPVEATPDMCIKGGIAAAEANVGAETSRVDVVNYAYAAMLAAAPKVE